jgi:hypothetical protein
MSGGAMIGLAIIIGLVILLFPFLVHWMAWFSVFMLFFGGVVALITQ